MKIQTSFRLSISALLASSLSRPTSRPFSPGWGTVESESPELEGAVGVLRWGRGEGPACETVVIVREKRRPGSPLRELEDRTLRSAWRWSLNVVAGPNFAGKASLGPPSVYLIFDTI